MRTLTHEEVRASLARALEERGEDYVYSESAPDGGGFSPGSCWYSTYDRDAGCIVGFVVKDQSPEDFEYLRDRELSLGESSDALSILSIDTASGWRLPGIQVSAAVADALQKAQRSQDEGHSWGAAVYEFDRAMEEAENE